MITTNDLAAFGYYDILDEEIFTTTYEEPQSVMHMVKSFAETANQEPDVELSAALIDEEYKEWDISSYGFNADEELKELADLVYVIYGYANVKGWDLDEAIRRVHENNMGRMKQPDGTIKYREDGKVEKNKDYPKVDLVDLTFGRS